MSNKEETNRIKALLNIIKMHIEPVNQYIKGIQSKSMNKIVAEQNAEAILKLCQVQVENSDKNSEWEIKAGTFMGFTVMDAEKESPVGYNEQYAIVFIEEQGFCWARYYTGSQRWLRTLDDQIIEPTYWLKLEMTLNP